MGLTLVIDEIITEERTYSFNKTLRVTDVNKAEVTEAYFAIKQIKYLEKESGETFSYTFKNNTSVKEQKDKTKIADIIRRKLKFDGDKKYTKNKQIIASFTQETFKAKETITIKALKKEKRTYYLKVDSGAMGNQMYLVVETKNLNGKKVKLKIHENEKELKLLKSKEAILPVLVFAKKEDKATDTEAKDWIELDIETVKAKDAGAGFYISDDGQDKEVGIKKIQLRPKKDKMASKTEEASKSFEGWAEKLYIREDETEAGKKKKEEEEKKKKEREAETFTTLTRDTDADKKENRKSYPKKISGTSTIEIGKKATYTITKYGKNATEADKKNIRWSLYIKGDAPTKYTVIDSKSKTGLYTYAKMELVNNKNQLTIIFDKALKDKKIQIEPYRNKPDIDQSKKKGGYDYIKSTSIKEKDTPKIAKLDTTKLWIESFSDNSREKEKEFLKGSFFKMKATLCKIDELYFFKKYDEKFSSNKLSESNKTSLVKIFNAISDYYFSEKRCCNLKYIAYMLATVKHETANTFNPISEYGGKKYFERMYDPVLGKSESRKKMAKANGNTKKGDGVKYKGRGFVQLTWYNNYKKMQDKFGINLTKFPEKALEHSLAIKIMIYGSEEGIFTGKKLSDYLNDKKTDYYNARRAINGTDKASSIENYAKKIEKCLKIVKDI